MFDRPLRKQCPTCGGAVSSGLLQDLRAQLRAATLALIRYGRHTPACERRSGECVLKPHTCNCGYGDALRKQGEDPR
jgi:hypothetical protein